MGMTNRFTKETRSTAAARHARRIQMAYWSSMDTDAMESAYAVAKNAIGVPPGVDAYRHVMSTIPTAITAGYGKLKSESPCTKRHPSTVPIVRVRIRRMLSAGNGCVSRNAVSGNQ